MISKERMSTTYDLDEVIPIEVSPDGDIILISLREFDRYLTMFEGLLEDMDRSEGSYRKTRFPSGAAGGRILVRTDAKGFLDI
jgi:hypothetical protein